MRLWSVHPQYLDRQGLIACWRETLLAQSVLTDSSRGYSNHPQLTRFRAHPQPEAAMSAFLTSLHAEAVQRGYRFDASKIRTAEPLATPISVTEGQLQFEWQHLMVKLEKRTPELAQQWAGVERPEAGTPFHVVHGPVEDWERGSLG